MFMPFTDASILLSAIYFSLSDEAREQNRPDLPCFFTYYYIISTVRLQEQTGRFDG